ncbi:hypothetical protein SAMN04515620_12090 [Collimonas sp. OK607]|nr:hypothetical protein SAMN04515620_12090 [Collimonas sp. OK607]
MPTVPGPVPAKARHWMGSIVAQRGTDGFVITPVHLPHGFEDFVDLVVPELQKRGEFRLDYQGDTLRSYLQG